MLCCGARINAVEPESMLWSQSLRCGARAYVVEPKSRLFLHDFSVSSGPVGTNQELFGQASKGFDWVGAGPWGFGFGDGA